jgi:hypothetical protein
VLSRLSLLISGASEASAGKRREWAASAKATASAAEAFGEGPAQRTLRKAEEPKMEINNAVHAT